jgi:catechol 2,3-dioxygenase-like lactoylglutathione lyase family enzyme
LDHQDKNMLELKGVVHFSIAVSDIEVSRKFYTENLRLELVRNAPEIGMVFLKAGDDYLILSRSDAPIARNPKDSRRAHHAFKIEPAKYDESKAWFTSRGVAVFDEEDRKRGVFVGRSFYVCDPDGTVLEFIDWDGTTVPG